jgi:hypothetical protein
MFEERSFSKCKLHGIINDISIDFNTRKPKISLLLDTNELSIVEELKNENKLNIELKKYRKPRSLDANKYFWKLLQEVCDYKDIDTIEEYKRRVKELGIFKQFKIMTQDVKTFEKIWTDRGIAWFCEIVDTTYIGDTEFKIINAYYGSSSYNSKQMSRLIDNLVQDCKAVGIETKPQSEIDSLLIQWDCGTR